MTGDRPLGNEKRGSDFPVRTTLRNEGGDAAFGGRKPLFARPPADAPELAARLLGPVCGPDMFEAIERGLDRLAGVPFLTRSPPRDSEREQCPSLSVGV